MPAGCHLEKAKGSSEQNIQYCSKEGAHWTRGEPPMTRKAQGKMEKERWATALKLAKQGRLDEIDEDIRCRYYRTWKEIRKDYMNTPAPLDSTCGIWIYGETGSGKTHVVCTTYPGRYIKPLNKWWDGYQGEDVVHLDEIAPSHCTHLTPYLKKWADKWPFDAETKGGAMQLRPKQVIVTSNYAIDEMGFEDADIGAIKRRFIEIKKEKGQNIII